MCVDNLFTIIRKSFGTSILVVPKYEYIHARDFCKFFIFVKEPKYLLASQFLTNFGDIHRMSIIAEISKLYCRGQNV
jgi:hypothetical protein